MNNKVLSIIIVLVLVVGGFFLFRGETEAPTEDGVNPAGTVEEGTTGEWTDTPASGENLNVKEFTVIGTNFSFDMKEMRVKEGDTVKVTFNNNMGMHDWNLDEFSVATQVLNAGESETIEFVANKKGSFKYYCSVGTHRAQGMEGVLVVE